MRFLVPSLRNCVVHPASTCWRTGHALRGFNVAFAARNRIGQGTGMLVRWDGYTIIHSWICWTHHSGYVEPLWATIHRNVFKSTRCFTLLLGFLRAKDMPKKTSCIFHLTMVSKDDSGGKFRNDSLRWWSLRCVRFVPPGHFVHSKKRKLDKTQRKFIQNVEPGLGK